jgi:hypothetical protein
MTAVRVVLFILRILFMAFQLVLVFVFATRGSSFFYQGF